MSKFEQESLSALLDGEVDELELRRLLKSMEGNPELAQRWERYHLAQSVLHDRGIAVSESLASNITQALAEEPVHSPVTRVENRWQQQLSRLAIAACVAIVAVVVLQPDSGQLNSPAMVQNEEGSTSNVQLTADSLIADSSAPVLVDPAAQERLREYIEAMSFDPEEPVHMEHIEDSPLYRLVNDYQSRP